MLNVGDLIIYPGHGICKVDSISDKTYAKRTRKYYVLHPIENGRDLTINAPVENKTTEMLKLINKEEAITLLEVFKGNGIDWIEKPQSRNNTFSDILKSGNRVEIAKVATTLMRKQYEIEKDGKKFYENDRKILTNIHSILFKELSLALDLTTDEIYEKVSNMISKSA
ncbi:CarD family transcriptional regulator [Ornithinibacillus halophilus]|uniref:Transcriptional regulator, CarD family n=1 Tax=Ornithinibacillus halophilus TaxID=930117 RepID=A0A1M5LFU6_9BACI|nr:CarD family transcriptional regulator [Ornithinibacillus halophilus]SHG63878.1 transcriptional regulator, CarD family [Ornithinibacillus halophilus]